MIPITVKKLTIKKLKLLRKKKQEIPINEIESVGLLSRATNSDSATQGPRNSLETALQIHQVDTGIQHEHKRTVYVRGIGLLWEGCLCLSVPVFTENTNQENI